MTMDFNEIKWIFLHRLTVYPVQGTSINYFLILEAPPKSPIFAIYRWLLYEQPRSK